MRWPQPRLPGLPSSCPHLRYLARTISNELVYSCVRDGWFRFGPERVLERYGLSKRASDGTLVNCSLAGVRLIRGWVLV